MQTIGKGTSQLIKDYLIGKYQGDAEWWQERFGQAKSLRDLIAAVREHYPEDIPALTQAILGRLTGSNPDDYLRQEAQRLAEAAFPSLYGYRCPLPDGVDMSKPGFDSFASRDNPSVAKAKVLVMQWADRTGPPILVLAGIPGTGKTHLAIAAAQIVKSAGQATNAAQHGYEGIIFRTEADMIGEVHVAMNKGNAEEVIEAYCEVPWLVLDDLGTQTRGASGWNEATLDRIINARWAGAGDWKGALRTLVTTNFKSADLPPRIASRLGDRQWGGGIITLDATDYRRVQQ